MNWPRVLAFLVAAISGGAMLYVGLYQSRAIAHMVCPLAGHGCHIVADAPFARPFGVPDGYVGAVFYGLIAAVLIAPFDLKFSWYPLLGLAALATLANILGVRDMMYLGAYCFYCLLTTLLSPVLLWSIWSSR
jgi:uncharacterized membrane protein